MVSHPKRMVSSTVLFCLPRSGLLLYVPPYLFIVEHIYFNVFVVYTGCWQRGGCSVLCCGQELHISIMQIVIITLSVHVCICVCVCLHWLAESSPLGLSLCIQASWVYFHSKLWLYTVGDSLAINTHCAHHVLNQLSWNKLKHLPTPLQRTHTHADTSFSVAPFARVPDLSVKRALQGCFHLCPAAGERSAASL